MKITKTFFGIVLALMFSVAATVKAQSIYVYNNGNEIVGEYGLNGAGFTPLISGLASFGIAASGTNLFVTSGLGTISEYTSSGATVNASLISNLGDIGLIAVCGTNMFVANEGGGAIGEYTTSGATVNASLISGLNEVIGIAISGTNLFVLNVDTNLIGTVGEYTTSGATVNASLISQLNYPNPNGIAVSGTNLFVASVLNGISEYTTSGTMVNASLISDSGGGIAIWGTNLFVANDASDTIGEYTTSGATVNASLISGLDNPGVIAIGDGPPPATPQLNVATAGSQSVLFYPSSAVGYVVQSTTNLASTNWVTATNGVPITGVTVTNSSPSLFFRLAPASGVAPTVNAQSIYVLNYRNGTVGEYGLNGTGYSPLVSGLDSFGIAVSGTNLFVANEADDTIGEYTTSGATVNASLISVSTPLGIAVSGTNLFDAAYYSIGEYTTSGKTVNASLISGLNSAIAIAISGTNLFVLNDETNTIGEYTTSGATVNASLISGLDFPVGIAVSGTNLYVATGFGVISEYTTSGAMVNASLISDFEGAGSLAVCGTNLFVANEGADTIGEYTTSGATVNASLISGLDYPAVIAIGDGPPPAAPQLNIAAEGNQSVLFYPSWAAGYVVQSTTNLASINWVTVTNGVPITGLAVTNSSPPLFFRLAPAG